MHQVKREALFIVHLRAFGDYAFGVAFIKLGKVKQWSECVRKAK